MFLPHDLHALANIIGTIAFDLGSLPCGIRGLGENIQRVGCIIHLRFHKGKAVNTGDNLRCILAQTIQNDAQRLGTYLIGLGCDTDGALCSRKGFMPGKKSKTFGVLF